MAGINENAAEGRKDSLLRPTSRDVAKLAGVSRTQVSYTMNGNGDCHVSEEKRQRIISAAKELGYSPLHSARALRKGYSNEFIILFPAPYPLKINQLIARIHETGLAEDCIPVQYSSNFYGNPQRKREALEFIISRRPIGVFCSLIDLDREEIEYLLSKGIKRILILDIEPHDDIMTLFLPNESIGYLVAEYFIRQGHRELGIIKPADIIQYRSFEFRLQGMRRALTDHPDIGLQILEWPAENPSPTLPYAETVVDRLLALASPLTGLYAYTDDYAITLLAALRKRGIRVPEEIAVMGTDNLQYGALFQPTLTTIDFDSNDIGVRAVALINALITGEAPDERFLTPPVPILFERESTAKPPGKQ